MSRCPCCRWDEDNASMRLCVQRRSMQTVRAIARRVVGETVWRCGMRPYHLSDCLRIGRHREVKPSCSRRFPAKRISAVRLSRIHNSRFDWFFSLWWQLWASTGDECQCNEITQLTHSLASQTLKPAHRHHHHHHHHHHQIDLDLQLGCSPFISLR